MKNDKYKSQKKWAEKNDYISKSYRMYRSQADAFADACRRAGVSQSAKLAELMQKFVEEQK